MEHHEMLDFFTKLQSYTNNIVLQEELYDKLYSDIEHDFEFLCVVGIQAKLKVYFFWFIKIVNFSLFKLIKTITSYY
jgi:hypothetical protein